MKSAILLFSGLLLLLLVLFGASAFGGKFVEDPTFGQAVARHSVLYERFGVHLADGHYPWFLPEFAGGYPAAAAWTYGLLSPATALFALLPAGPAWTWSAILHLLFAALGMYLFVRALSRNEAAAATAAVVYALSEFMIGRSISGQLFLVWPAAWLPFAFLGLRRAARGERGGVALAGLTLGLGLLSGEGRLWCYLLPVLLVYAMVEGLCSSGKPRALGRVAAALALATLVSAVQWSATAELASFSNLNPEGSVSGELVSARMSDLVGKVFPGFLGRQPEGYWGDALLPYEFVAVGGPGILLLALLGVLSGGRGRFFWLGAAAFGVLLAAGIHNPVSKFLTGLPVLSLGEVPGRALLLSTFALAVLAGLGAAGFMKAQGKRRRVLAILAGCLLLLLLWGALLLLYPFAAGAGPDRFSETGLPAVLWGILGLSLVGLGLWLAGRGPRWAILVPTAVAVCALSGGIPPVESVDGDAYFRDWSADLPEDARPYRMFVQGFGPYPTVERTGWRTMRPLCALDASWFHEAMGFESLQMHYWLNIRAYVLGMTGNEAGWAEPMRPPRVMDLMWPSGRGMVLREYREQVPDAEVAHILGDWRRELLFPGTAERAPPGGPGAPEDGVEFIEETDPNRLTYIVRASDTGWLYAAEKYYPFWKATVDGEGAPCQRVNLTGMAIPVPAGEHRVALQFSPASSRWGPALSLLGIVLCVFLFSRSRSPSGNPPSLSSTPSSPTSC